jgi:hypothetical protein
VELVQIAAATMADYSRRKIEDQKKRAESHNRGRA